jgi:competence protein ComEC
MAAVAHPSLARAIEALADQVGRQTDRWTLWTPVALGLGCALYFGLPREPQGLVAWGLLPVVAGLLITTRWSAWRALTIVLVLSACALGGFAVAKLRAESVKAPVAPAGARPQWVEAWVVDVASPGQGGQRLLLAPVRIGDWSPAATPIRMRVTLRPEAELPSPGDPVRLLAILNPPPPPASPGSYDFARDAYFESVGAVGLALRAPQWVAADTIPPWRLRLTMRINAIRWALTQRIVATLGPETGGLAAAMTTGHEAFIPREQVENLRAAGLAHIIWRSWAASPLHPRDWPWRPGPGWLCACPARRWPPFSVWSPWAVIWCSQARRRRPSVRRSQRRWPSPPSSQIVRPSACTPWRSRPWSFC